VYEVMSFCNEVVRYKVPLHPFHRFVYANALLFLLKGTETIEAAAKSFCRLLRNWPKAVFFKRALAEDLSVPFAHDSGMEPYLEQLALVKHEENDNVEDDHSPRVTGLPNPFRLPMFPSDHRRAADTRFFCGRELMPTAWAAEFFRAPRTFDLSRWLPPFAAWEPHMGLWVATPVVVSYLADALRNAYSSLWQEVYSEYYCNFVAAWVHTGGCHGYIPEDYIRALYPYPLRIQAGGAYPKCIMRKGGEDISILSDRNCEIISDPYPRYKSQDTGIYTVMRLPATGEF